MKLGNPAKIVLAFLAGALIVVIVGGVIGWSLLRAGTFEVQVREGGRNGTHFSLKLPVCLARFGVNCVPDAVIEDAVGEVEQELGEWLPLVQATCRELARCPDFDLVSVESDGERVLIRKDGKRMIVHVLSDEDEVRVVVPIKAVAELLEQCARKAS
jgi:hypothetical protein